MNSSENPQWQWGLQHDGGNEMKKDVGLAVDDERDDALSS
jgi:hypothetical protein